MFTKMIFLIVGLIFSGIHVSYASSNNKNTVALHTVALHTDVGSQKMDQCTATLLSENTALTDAFCVVDIIQDEEYNIKVLEKMHLIFGSVADETTARSVKNITVSPKFDNSWRYSFSALFFKPYFNFAIIHFDGGLPAGYAPVKVLAYDPIYHIGEPLILETSPIKSENGSETTVVEGSILWPFEYRDMSRPNIPGTTYPNHPEFMLATKDRLLADVSETTSPGTPALAIDELGNHVLMGMLSRGQGVVLKFTTETDSSVTDWLQSTGNATLW